MTAPGRADMTHTTRFLVASVRSTTALIKRINDHVNTVFTGDLDDATTQQRALEAVTAIAAELDAYDDAEDDAIATLLAHAGPAVPDDALTAIVAGVAADSMATYLEGTRAPCRPTTRSPACTGSGGRCAPLCCSRWRSR